MKIVYVKDKGGNGYTVFFAERPNIIAEAKTKKEAKEILEKNLQLILEFEKK